MKRWVACFLTIMMLLAGAIGGAESALPQSTGEPAVPPAEETVAAAPMVSADVPIATPEPTDLTLNARGDAVQALQERLQQLGFFYTAIDGIYGANTQAAVREFEEYIRLIEQRDIDAQIAAMATSEPALTPTPEPESEGVQAVATPDPTPTPEPTATPTPAPTPETAADGLAEIAVQELAFGDPDALYLCDVAQGDSGLAARRIQRRLVALNYLDDAADGVFGVNSETALIAFQAAHDLEQTGTADRETQARLFSSDVKTALRPVYNRLTLWSSGEGVKNVQKQLVILGFMNGSVNGTYGESTRAGVMALEKYLYKIDNAPAAPEPTAAPDEGVQAVEPIIDSASDEANLAADDPETNPYEVMPTLSAEEEQDSDFEPTGVMTADLQIRLLEDGIPIYQETVSQGSRGDEVRRVQRRLYSLNYLTASGVDGVFGAGTEKAVSQFQGRNGLEKTGIADQATQSALFSEDAVKSIKPYQIKISIDDQRVYVYSPDDSDNYSILVKTFVCSTGTRDHPTPLGTFTNTGPGARWHYFKKFDCWAQYAWYVDGDIMIHSVLYSEADESTLRRGSVSALGKRSSHGCIRLSVEDAQWIYNNCASGTTVVVY